MINIPTETLSKYSSILAKKSIPISYLDCLDWGHLDWGHLDCLDCLDWGQTLKIEFRIQNLSSKFYFQGLTPIPPNTTTTNTNLMDAESQHPGIQRIQDIYRKHKNRMYHWARDRDIPADNNFAERELRPLAIARKVSFGSQSEEGALTRETLMSILRTMNLRGRNVKVCLKKALDELSANPQINPFSLLFPSSPTQN